MIQAFCRIPLPELFDFSESLWYLNRNFDDISHRIERNSVVKAIRTDDEILLFRVSDVGEHLQVDLLAGSETADNRTYLENYVRHWFDMDIDIRPFYELLNADPRLAHLTQYYRGFRTVGINELFEALGWSIIGQQINLSFAYRLKRRVTETYGTTVTYQDKPYYLFPQPEELALADISALREMQFSQKKQNT